nr:MAG TPA: hypothetical protein [Caudoviricetes sp.]
MVSLKFIRVSIDRSLLPLLTAFRIIELPLYTTAFRLSKVSLSFTISLSLSFAKLF